MKLTLDQIQRKLLNYLVYCTLLCSTVTLLYSTVVECTLLYSISSPPQLLFSTLLSSLFFFSSVYSALWNLPSSEDSSLHSDSKLPLKIRGRSDPISTGISDPISMGMQANPHPLFTGKIVKVYIALVANRAKSMTSTGHKETYFVRHLMPSKVAFSQTEWWAWYRHSPPLSLSR